jgi:glycosyltransferase involved in cell wall biosynthesis
MRLLYLSADPGVPVFGGKGASIHLRAMATALGELGHEVIVASPRGEAGHDALPDHIRCAEIPAVQPRDCNTAAEVRAQACIQAEAVLETARGEGIEAIYERYSLSSFAGARTADALGVPLVVEVNAPLRIEARRFRTLWHEDVALEAERETFSAAGAIFAVSGALADWLSAGGIDRSRVQVMPNAPPARPFAPKRPLDERSQLVVGFAGGLKPWHGVDTMLRGFGLAADAGARMRLEILGEGPAADQIRQASLPQGQLIHLGHRPHREALAILERWDVGLAPFSAVEGFYFSPLKLFEYMAAGLCPVVSDVGDLAETVEHGRAGVVVSPGDAGALGRILLELDRDRARLRRLGAQAQASVRRQPSWADNAARVATAIEAVGIRAGTT